MFEIVHYVDKEEKLQLLLTCPMCKADMYQTEMIEFKKNKIDSNNKKEIIIKEMRRGLKEVNKQCPHCQKFRIRYINGLGEKKVMRDANQYRSEPLKINKENKLIG